MEKKFINTKEQIKKNLGFDELMKLSFKELAEYLAQKPITVQKETLEKMKPSQAALLLPKLSSLIVSKEFGFNDRNLLYLDEKELLKLDIDECDFYVECDKTSGKILSLMTPKIIAVILTELYKADEADLFKLGEGEITYALFILECLGEEKEKAVAVVNEMKDRKTAANILISDDTGHMWDYSAEILGKLKKDVAGAIVMNILPRDLNELLFGAGCLDEETATDILMATIITQKDEGGLIKVADVLSENKDKLHILSNLAGSDPEAIAEMFSEIEREKVKDFLPIMDTELISKIFKYMNTHAADNFFNSMDADDFSFLIPNSLAAAIFLKVSPETLVHIIEDMVTDRAGEIFAKIDNKKVSDLYAILNNSDIDPDDITEIMKARKKAKEENDAK